MNFRQRLLRSCTLGCGLLMIFSTLVRPASAAAIPGEIKTGTDADKHRSEIAATIKSEIDELTGDDLAKRAKARDALIVEVNAPGNAPFSPAFLDVYAQELDKQLMPLTDNADPRIRLNAAIIVAHVGEKVDSARFFDVTEKLLHDKSDAVLIWALKAARVVLPPVLQVGAPADQQKLIAAIKSHADNPTLLPLVYSALALRYEDNRPNVPNRDKMVATVVPEILSLLQDRVKMYQKEVPPEPAAVVPAVLFLSNPTTWNAMNKQPAVQMQIVQTLSDLIGVAAQRAAVAGGAQAELDFVVTKAASGLGAIALTIHAQAVYDALQPLIHSAPGNPQILVLASAVPTTLKLNPAWATIKPAPAIESNSSTTAPATATAPAK